MTEAEALAKMKRQCKVLSEALTDTELVGFLNDHRTGADPDYTYDLRRSIYEALGSAMTVLDQQFSRGGVSYTRADLFKLRKQFRPLVVGVVVRDIS